MKKNLFLLSLLCFVASVGVSLGQQSLTLDEYEALKKRTIVIVIEEPKEKLLKNLTPDEAATYQAEIKEHNDYMKKAFEVGYTAPIPVVFKTSAEAEAIQKAKDKSFAILYAVKFDGYYATKATFQMTQKNRFMRDQTRLSGALSMMFVPTGFELFMAEAGKMGNALIKVFIPSPFPDLGEMIYSVKQFNEIMLMREAGLNSGEDVKSVKSNAKILEGKKLAILDADLESPQTAQVDFAKHYPYPVEVVSRDRRTEIMTNGDAEYAVVFTVPILDPINEKAVFIFYAVDAKTGKQLASSSPQEEFGAAVETKTISALKALKKTATDSKVPPVRKENLVEFKQQIKSALK